MNNYNNEDDEGYFVFEDDTLIHWFETYDEVFEEFGEMAIWNNENEMYIVQNENAGENVEENIIKVLPESYNNAINEL